MMLNRSDEGDACVLILELDPVVGEQNLPLQNVSLAYRLFQLKTVETQEEVFTFP